MAYIYDDSHEYTGNPATFTDSHGTSDISGVSVTMQPIQDLHGYDHPWPAGGGKNKLNIDAISDTEGLVINNGSLVVSAPSGRDNITSVESLSDFADLVVGQQYALTFTTTYSGGNYIYLRGSSEVWTNGGTKTITQAMLDGKVSFYSGVGGTATISNLMIRLSAETDATFAPYSNICPISGRTGLSVYVGPTTAQADATTYSVDWTTEAGTVYGGTLDVVTGQLVIDKYLYVYDGTESFSKSGTALNGFYNQLTGTNLPHGWPAMANYYSISVITDEASSMMIPTRNGDTYKQNYGYVYFDSGHNFDVPPEEFGTTVESFKAKLASLYADGTPLTVFCKLATPLTYQLTPKSIGVIKNSVNNLWASNNESITVTVSDILYGFQGWLIKVGNPLVEIPTTMIEAASYKVTPDQRMEESAERDTTGYLWRDTVRNTPTKIEFNTPPTNNTDVSNLNSILRTAFTVTAQRRLPVAFYDPEEDCYKTCDAYMPDVEYPMHLIDPSAKTVLYDSIRYAFIGY